MVINLLSIASTILYAFYKKELRITACIHDIFDDYCFTLSVLQSDHSYAGFHCDHRSGQNDFRVHKKEKITNEVCDRCVYYLFDAGGDHIDNTPRQRPPRDTLFTFSDLCLFSL